MKPGTTDKPIAQDVPRGAAPLETAEEPLSVGKVALQFFLIPLLIVAFCVAIVLLFRWLTYEQKNVDDYLAVLRQGPPVERGAAARNLFGSLMTYIPESKRWQGIYDVTRQLRADKVKFLQAHPGFTEQVVAIYKDPQNDPKTRRYLALTLGAIGNREASAALVEALGDTDSEAVISALLALGNIQDSSTIPAIRNAARRDDAGVRQAAVYVLGSFEADEVVPALRIALNDPDELVTWNAAFGLARHGSAEGEKVLTRLLDFEYVSKQGSLTVDQRQQIRTAAVQLLARLGATSVVPQLETLSAGDPDMPVRQAAIEALKSFKK